MNMCSLPCIILLHILMSIPTIALPLSDEVKKTCKVLAEHKLPEVCPVNNRTSDWLCQAESFNCYGEEQFHCAQVADIEPGKVKFMRKCTKPVTCAPGEEPYVKQGKSTPRCGPCRDKKYYNPHTLLSSWFSQCPEKKVNQCTEEKFKKDCGLERGGLSWKQTTQSDGLCRCDSRAGYRPVDFDENPAKYLSDHCFYEYVSCVHFTCTPGMELSLDYRCIHTCLEGYSRSNLSDVCRNLSDQTEIPLLTITNLEQTKGSTMTESSRKQATPTPFKNVTKSMEDKQDMAVSIIIPFSILLALAGSNNITLADEMTVATTDLKMSVVDILKFTAGASYEVNVISESQVGSGSSTNGDRALNPACSPASSSSAFPFN
ncbi:uncharacterized protein LOC127831522 [Dreissena polymorpha]|uniref:uncharacterized protein LOC127831522 n=1 Tax=Dreissena polymorpha TaxID=45954 RepID=UPI002264921F|nr:uncharacterized protein LOC127831522 [Dreissena polymorpha]